MRTTNQNMIWPSRRTFLWGSAAAFALYPVVSMANNQPAAVIPFDYDWLTSRAEKMAQSPYTSPSKATLPADLTYDLYRQIAFDPDRARWSDSGSDFRMHAFHLGWLFDSAVPLHEVSKGVTTPFTFEGADFDYRNDAAHLFDEQQQLPGVAGFRLHYPLNRADVLDELLAFQGASYFRALGRDNAYGLSSRGLAIATATDQPEEFPNFTEFYLVRPGAGDTTVTIYALLDSESVTGAYRFVVTPGQETDMDVTARLWFRKDVPVFGVAPLTSMFLFSEVNRSAFDDYRRQVHDSDGLAIHKRNGEVLWRALSNPPRLATSHFVETSPRGFGLHQRNRDFEAYQDPEARYEDRPSVHVEMLDDWGEGDVRLVELPTDLEINDNIVAFWAPKDGAKGGDAREFSYRLRWGMLPTETASDTAFVVDTRAGKGGVSGVEEETAARKFVIDFAGGLLGQMASDAELTPRVAVTGGKLTDQVLFKIDETEVWRLALDVEPTSEVPIELMAHIEGYGKRLSETWLYQWLAEV